jgi:hypothetical protein
MRAVAPKRARELREYRPLRDAFLAEHPWCQFPGGCDRATTELHHRRGRRGLRLLDQAWWAASCAMHNDFAETRTGEALDLGWLVRVEGVAS